MRSTASAMWGLLPSACGHDVDELGGAEAAEVFVGGGGGGVAELVGDSAQRYAGVAEVDREGVAQPVRVDPFVQAGSVGEAGDRGPDVAVTHRAAEIVRAVGGE